MSKVVSYFKENKLHLVMWCVFLALVMTLFFNGTFSKHNSEYGGSGDLSIAKFDVITQNDEDSVINLSENNTTDSYVFYIKSQSQVSVGYDVVLTLPNGESLPEYISVSIDGKIEPVAVSNKIFFDDVGVINHGENEQIEHTIEFVLDVDAYAVYGKEIKIEGIEIQVIATQII